MNVTYLPSVERLSASSDFEEKLVTSWSRPWLAVSGTCRVLISLPDGVTWSRNIGDVMPKFASTWSLFHTPGYVPSLFAVTQSLVQPGGRVVRPAATASAPPSYTDRLISRLPGRK